MALVLTGAISYSVPYLDENGIEQRINVRRGQSVDSLNLSKNQVEILKASLGHDGNGYVPLFVELEAEQEFTGRYTGSGRISGAQMVAASEEEVVAEVVAEAVEAPAVEVVAEAVVEAPAKKASAKKAKK